VVVERVARLSCFRLAVVKVGSPFKRAEAQAATPGRHSLSDSLIAMDLAEVVEAVSFT
jgi:hypothetical protein